MRLLKQASLFLRPDRTASGVSDFREQFGQLSCNSWASRLVVFSLAETRSMDDSMGIPPERATSATSPLQLVLLTGWAIAVACLGGYLCGLAIAKLGTIGTASLWLAGEGAGFVGRKLISEKSRIAGTILVFACLIAFVFAEVCWIHWRIIPARESWLAAVRYLPTFVEKYTLAAVIGGVFCFMGANSAYRQVARRYRIVHIMEE